MGKLYFHYSTMNAGKSTALLQANHNYIERGMKTHLLTAKLDDRAGMSTGVDTTVLAVRAERAGQRAEAPRTVRTQHAY